MNQIKSKSWPNVPYKTWQYEKQTEMKHKVFGYYLPLWIQILGRWSKNLNYIDGFGGIGSYHTEEDIQAGKLMSRNFGSPIISLMEIQNLEKQNKIKKVNALIIDKEQKNLDNINQIKDFTKIKCNGTVCLKRGNFDEEINSFLDFIDSSGKNLAPTFFLIDPFGIADIKFSTIRRIMTREKTEILLNFMYNSLQHWITHPNEKINKIYDEYFDGNKWRDCQKLKLAERESQLIDLFRNKCKKICKFVYPFRLKFPYKNKTYYYLFHLTQHYKGCSLMKNSFARFNNGKSEYNGENYQSNLFAPMEEKEKKENFFEKIRNYYRGRIIKYVDILNRFIDETDLLESEIIKLLKIAEENRKITVQAGDIRKRRGGFKENDNINFA